MVTQIVHDSPETFPVRDGRKRGNDTHEKLYQAALAAFAESGFADTLIEDITDRAGTSRASFYFHFPTKDEVLIEAQQRRTLGILANIQQQIDDADTYSLSVKEFLEVILNAVMLQAEKETDPKLLQELLALQIRKPSQEGRNNPVAKVVFEFFKQAAGKGKVREDLSAADLTKAFMNCVFELLREVAENPKNYRKNGKRIIKIFIRGVAP